MARGTSLADDDSGDMLAIDPRFIETHPAIFWTMDVEGRLSISSRRVAERLGVPQHSPEARSQVDLFHPGDRKRVAQATQAAREDGTMLDIEARIRSVGTGYRWMRLRARFDAAAQRWYGSTEDVHDRHEAEAALKIANQRLALALEGNNAWAWDLDVPSGRFWYSDGWKAVLGYKGGEIRQDLCDFQQLVHPDDQAMVAALHHAHLVGDTSVFEADYRLRTKDGGWVWVHDRGRVTERDAEGKPLRAIGVRTDISARKEAEAHARASEAYLKTLLDNIADGVIAVGSDGRRGFYNRAYSELFFEEAGASEWIDLERLLSAFDLSDLDGKAVPRNQRPIMRILAGETIRDLQLRAHLQSSGRVLHLVYNGQPIFDAEGNVELAVMSVRDVTERQATLAALQSSEIRFRGLFESGVVGMCIFDSKSGDVLAANDRLIEMTGSSREAFENGKWDWRAATPPDLRALDDLVVAEIETRGMFHPYEKAFVRPDGSRIDVRLSSAPMPGRMGQIAVCIEDITDRRRSEESLRESESRLEAIIESLEEGVIAIGPDRRILFANAAYRQMVGPAPGQPAAFTTLDAALSAFDLIDAEGEALPPERRPTLRLLAGERIPLTDGVVRFPDGRQIDTVYRGEPIFDTAGQVKLAILVVRDVTRRKQAEADLKALQQELIQVSRVSAMGTMAGALAHELNQPLAAVANYSAAAQMMLTAPGDGIERAVGVLKRVADEAVRAGQIVNRLRRFITKGEVERQAESLGAIVREAVAIASSDASTRGTQVKLKLDPAADLVIVDRIQLQQVAFNLVRNAVEAMAGQAERELTIATRAAGDEIELIVADRGPGLAQEVAERLFEPFVTTKASGMGIGLPICRSIVRAHGGDIRAEPRPSGGTVFIVTLPAATAAD